MNYRRLFLALVSLLSIGVCFLALTHRAEARQGTKAQPARTAWEYKVVDVGVDINGSNYPTTNPEFEARLNALGKDGWELVPVQRASFTMIFRRPKQR